MEVARRRLVTQTRRTVAQPERASKYCETFEKMKKEGHAESVEEEEKTGESFVHYLTHFASDLEKFRVVYNGALKINGVSINDMLHRGPMFLESLVVILIRFRQHSVAITADIKNMFFQIRLHPKDRYMLRFFPFTGKKSGEKQETGDRDLLLGHMVLCVFLALQAIVLSTQLRKTMLVCLLALLKEVKLTFMWTTSLHL